MNSMLKGQDKVDIRKVKKLEDFPKFVATAVRRGATSDSGYTSFEIEGRFDPILEDSFGEIIDGTRPQWFWLLPSEGGYLCPTLKSFDRQSKTVLLECDEKEDLKVLGSDLAYLSPYWQGFHVWMVLDQNWGWKRTQLHGVDAVAEDYEARDTSIIEGREIRVWTKLEPVGTSGWQSRHYPATDQTLPVRSGTRLIPGGWNHEHCELCRNHIDGGMFGYCDPQERWMCENCYERYVTRRDLSFVDEL